MKVTIQTRQVYHKYAQVEIEVCEDDFDDFRFENGKWTTLQDYLICKEELYTDKIDEAISKAKYECGNGIENHDGMNEPESESEWRYECEEIHDGGHL
tara:strand:+ start:10345 stop:10638 length:294 start_codon:yes stop_codon:yes gene_type:complete